MHLTNREIEVLSLMAKGLSNKEIAERLVITLSTVKCNIHRIYEKLGLEDDSTKSVNRVKAVLIFQKMSRKYFLVEE